MTVEVDLVVFAIRDSALRVALVRREAAPLRGAWALPGGRVRTTESLDAAAARVLRSTTGLDDPYLEQLYTFGDPDRDPRGRAVSVAYLAVVPGGREAGRAVFHPARRPPGLALDHAAILAKGVERLGTKSEYSTVPLRFLKQPFTLSEVQAVYEVLLERELDKRNFRRKMLALEALQETESQRRDGAHRPARLFRLAPSHPHLLRERGILFPF